MILDICLDIMKLKYLATFCNLLQIVSFFLLKITTFNLRSVAYFLDTSYFQVLHVSQYNKNMTS